MGCEKNFKVEPLSEEESWNLFRKKFGKALPPEFELIAKSIVRECAGLPLGIITIAGSMRGAADVCEWRNALRELQESGISESDIEYEVFRVLKFSYNCLTDSALQQCFLYCALYPEDHKIRREELIELLIVEGIIEEMTSRETKFDRGHAMLNKLEKFCLLEGGTVCGYRYVKMHDLIRDMAIQIMKVDPRAMVKAGMQLFEMPDWGNCTDDLLRISLMYNDIEEIPSGHSPRFPNLSTLLLGRNQCLTRIADSFFEQLHGLKVLDLSHTGISQLPDSIAHLENLIALLLGGCKVLRHVPSLALLRALKKLDLSYSAVEEVPQGIELLSNLRYLDLRGARIKELPSGILRQLSHLQFLMLGRSFTVQGEEVATLRKLETLNCRFSDVGEFNKFTTSSRRCNLTEYNIVIRQNVSPNYEPPRDWKGLCFYGCNIRGGEDALFLPRDVQYLHFNGCNIERNSLCLKNANQLKFFGISNCDGIECLDLLFSSSIFQILEGITIDNLKATRFLFSREGGAAAATIGMSPPNGTFSSLKTFLLWNCPSMQKLFDPVLLLNLQNIEEISVRYCENMEELVTIDDNRDWHNSNGNIQFTLPKLQSFELKDLPQLKSICNGKLICNSLQTICVDKCPKLRRMPLSLLLLDNERPSRLPSLQKIEISPREWWQSVELDHPFAKDVLLPFCDFRKGQRGTVR